MKLPKKIKPWLIKNSLTENKLLRFLETIKCSYSSWEDTPINQGDRILELTKFSFSGDNLSLSADKEFLVFRVPYTYLDYTSELDTSPIKENCCREYVIDKDFYYLTNDY